MPIVGITLTPSSGSPIPIFSPTSNANFEMTRLQTDSSLVADKVTVAAGTYTSISVTLASSSGIFINQSGATVGACAAGAVCGLPNGAATTITFTFPSALVLTSDQTQWIGLDFNLNKAITTSNGISVDFTQTGVMTATTTPRRGLPSGSVETIEDFVGVVTAYTSGSSITVQSSVSGQTITAALNGSTEYDEVPTGYSGCVLAPSCIKVGSTVSMDVGLALSGALTATEVDVLEATGVNEVEGVIYPTSTAGVFGLILADKVVTDSNAALTNATYGAGILVTISPTANGYIDTKTLSIPLSNPVGFSTSDFAAGQMIRAQITSATTGTGGVINATAGNLLLRFSRITATVSATGTTFTVTNLPTYITALNTSLPTTPQVVTYLNYTLFDGLVNTTDPVFVAGTTVSFRALYLSNSAPSFQAAKVRVP